MHAEREVLTGANATTVVRRSIDTETGGGMDPIANICICRQVLRITKS